MKFEFRTVKCNNFNALISNLMVRKLPVNLKLPKIMLSHHVCLKIPSNARETRNARPSAGQATKTIRFYIENHTESAPPLHDSSTLDHGYLESNMSCAHFSPHPSDSLNASPTKSASHHKVKHRETEKKHNTATPQGNEIRASEDPRAFLSPTSAQIRYDQAKCWVFRFSWNLSSNRQM